MTTPRLLALSTAVPPHVLRQDEVRASVQNLFADGIADPERMLPVFDNAGIETRHSCVPLAWYLEPHGWADRNRVYLENAVALCERVARDCLAQSGLDARDLDGIVTVSTTGVATPSLDALLMERLDLRRDLQRLPVFGLGCAGGVLGLSRAAALARAAPGSRILLLVVELCALWFQRDDNSKSGVVAAALFGDGAAGAIVSCRGDGPAISAAGEHTWPDSLKVMGWDVEDTGLRAIFSRDIPALVRTKFRDAAEGFLGRNGLSLADIDTVVCHPGGTKVLSAIEEALDLGPDALAPARDVLRRYGNMSAATVMFVLREVLRRDETGRMFLSALGPGFTAAFLVLERAAVQPPALRAMEAVT